MAGLVRCSAMSLGWPPAGVGYSGSRCCARNRGCETCFAFTDLHDLTGRFLVIKGGRHARPIARLLGLVAVCIVASGTSCVGPAVYVVHRFELLGTLDSAYSLPMSLKIGPLLL